MHTIEIPEAKIIRYLPSNLGECDSQQYIDMCELIYRYQTGQIIYQDMRVQAVYKLMNLKVSGKQLLITDDECKWANLYTISKLIDNCFEDKDGQKVIKMDYTHNPVPKFKPLWRTYYGPSDGFMNITFGEYTDGLRLFLEFSATGNMRLLYLLAAVFYRKGYWRKRNGDIRKPYNPHEIEDRADVFKYMPLGVVYGFYLLFASFQKYLTGAVIPWGGKELDFSIIFDGDKDDKETVPGIGMDALAFSLAESGEFGNLNEVRKTSFWEIMIRLYDLKKKDLEQKAKETSNAKS